MKVPDNLLYTVFKYQDDRIRESIAKKMIEISTGKKVHNISDDPVVTQSVMNLKKDISQLSQFSRNRLFADINLTYIDFTLGKISDKLKEIHSKVILAKNGTNTPDTLISFAAELDKALSYLLDRANEKVGENYIFSGSALTTKPFDSNFNYLGSQRTFDVQMDEGSFVEVFQPGGKVFSTNVYTMDTLYNSPTDPFGVSGTMNVTYDAVNVSVDYGRGIWYLSAKVSDPNVPLSNYGLEGDLILYDNAMNEVARIANYGSLSLNDLVTQINTTFGGQNISAAIVNNPDGTYTLKITDGDVPPDNFISDTGNNVLESNNLQNFVSILNAVSPEELRAFVHQVPDGRYTLRLIPEEIRTSVNITFTGTALGNFSTSNVFQIVSEIKDKLLSSLSPDDSDLAAVRRSYDKVIYERSKSGSILSQVRSLQDTQETRMDTLRKQKSDAEEVDLSESVAEYTRYRLAYEALMRIVADVKDITILRYL